VSKSENYRITKSVGPNHNLESRFKEADMVSLQGSGSPYPKSMAKTGLNGEHGEKALTERGPYKKRDGSELTKSATKLPKKVSMTSMILKALQSNPSQMMAINAQTEQSDSCIFGLRLK